MSTQRLWIRPGYFILTVLLIFPFLIGKAANIYSGNTTSNCNYYHFLDENNNPFSDGLKALTIIKNPENEETIIEQRTVNNSLVFRLKGKQFLYRENGQIVGNNIAVSIYMGKDSIFHPSINLKLVPEQKLLLYSGEKSITQSPFFDSYHQIFIFSEKLQWNAVDNKLLISPSNNASSGQRRIKMESADFFDANYYFRMQNTADYHPLVRMKILVDEYGDRNIPADLLAQKMNPRFSVSHIQSLLFDLEQYGFLNYYPKKQLVVVQDKVFRYVEAAKKFRDSDAISIISDTPNTNAVIDLNTGEMVVEGVRNVPFQKRQVVGIKPLDKTVRLTKNRNTAFDGRIFAGFANITGSDMLFDYEKFQIHADSIDFLDFYVPDFTNQKGDQPSATGIGSRLERLSGIILVNAPGNKSGREFLDDFPAFRSNRPAYVYYDLNNKQGKVYQKENFYFEVAPFQFNGLAKFTEEDLSFKGKLVSSDIFPEFEETLVFQEHDRSLGFTTSTPEEGYEIYKGKGAYKGEINLSNNGVEGQGVLWYEATRLESVDMVFRPEEMTCMADSFYLKKDESRFIPEAYGSSVEIRWTPYSDSMAITSKNESFHLFNQGEHKIGGELMYTPHGLKGKGIFDWGEGEMTSNVFSFGATSITTEKTDLKIKTLENDGIAFDTQDLNGEIDFEQKMGRFKANDAKAITNMPYNKYITTLNEFEWDLGKRALTLVAAEGEKGTFVSTHPAQDSLKFQGTAANYDFETSEMNIHGVPFIKVADALIYPEKYHVVINSDGFVKQLHNADITADFHHQYHKIQEATVFIGSSNDFSGKGKYIYKGATEDQIVFFDDIKGKAIGKGKKGQKLHRTTGRATIKKDQLFLLNDYTKYEGNVVFESDAPNLQFDGHALLNIDLFNRETWFALDFEGEKDNLIIPNEKPKSKDGEPLYTGLYIDRNTGNLYTSIIAPLRDAKDRQLFDATGAYQQTDAHRLKFGDLLSEENYKPGYLLLDTKNATAKTNGSLNICPNIKGVDFGLYGSVQTGFTADQLADSTMASTEVLADFALTFSPGLTKSLEKILMDDIVQSTFGKTVTSYYEYDQMASLIQAYVPDESAKQKALGSLKSFGVFQADLGKDEPFFILSNLKATWNPDFQSFVLKDKKVDIVRVGGQSVNRPMDILIEIHHPHNGIDRFKMYFRTSEEHYYYFAYKNGILSMNSNNQVFKAAFEKAEKGNKIKGSNDHKIQWVDGEQPHNFRRKLGDK